MSTDGADDAQDPIVEECSRLARGDPVPKMLEGAGLSVPDMERYGISWLWGMMTAQAGKDPA